MKQLGRYEILAELGRGAMGTVFRARDPKIDRIVALKTISLPAGASEQEQADYRERFFREAQAAGKLSHPGIVTIYDVDEDPSTRTPFIVMEFVEGQTLEECVQAQPMPVATALDLVQQLAQALDYAHRRSIIHRDIKPANIMVTPEGRAKIADFGVAKLATTHYTQPGQLLGTPAYMAPEQLSGSGTDGRSDLFSLGVILYWLLTGDKPFAGETTTAVSFKIVYTDPVAPSQLNPSLTAGVDRVLTRALAKNPASRYQSGEELARDLSDLAAGRDPRSLAGWVPPVTAGPQSTVVAAAASAPTVASAPVHATLKAAPVPPPPEEGHRWLIPTLVLVALLSLTAGWLWRRSQDSQPAKRTSQEQLAASIPAGQAPQPAAPSAGRPQRRTQSAASRDATKRTADPSAQAGSVEEPQARDGDAPGNPPSQEPVRQPTSRRTRTPAPAVVPAQTSTLRLTGEHNFTDATLFVYVDDAERPARTFRLRSGSLARSPLPLGMGEIRGSLSLPTGEHTISIRIRAPRDGFDEMKAVRADFPSNGSRTLKVGVGKLGKWIGVGDLTRKLTLKWVD